MNHEEALEKLVNTPSIMGMKREEIEFMLPEPVWLKNKAQLYKLCDLIVGFYEGYAVPVEVKRSHGDEGKQLRNGRKFIEQVLKRVVPYGLLMVYRDNGIFLEPEIVFHDERVEVNVLHRIELKELTSYQSAHLLVDYQQ